MTEVAMSRIDEIEARHEAFDSTGQEPKTEEGRDMMRRVEAMAFTSLCGSRLTDMEVAFEIASANRHDLNLVAAQTTAKDRVRWLSANLHRAHLDRAFLLSTIRALQAEVGEMREAAKGFLNAWDWWRLDEHDRDAGVPADAAEVLRATLKDTSNDN